MKNAIKIFFFLIVSIVIIYLGYVYFSFGFLLNDEHYYLFALFSVDLFLIGGSMIFMRNKGLKYLILGLVSLVVVFFTGDFLKEYQNIQTKENATKVIEMLIEYKTTNGTYPNKLEDLSRHIPKNIIGIFPKNFGYKKIADSFQLELNSYRYSEIYNSKTNKWYNED